MKEIQHILERMEMGVTAPFLCKDEQGEQYVVKTINMMPLKELLAEYIGCILAQKLELPCPKTELVYFNPSIIEYAPSRWKSDLSDCICFGSMFLEKSQVAKKFQAHNPKYFPEDKQKLLYMFDRWILNTDRTSSPIGTGNINLLFTETQKQIFVIDHNLAFKENEDSDFEYHIFAPQHREWRLDWIDRETFTEKAIDILGQFDDIYQSIPDCWIPVDDYQKFENIINDIKRILERIYNDNYWNNII